MDDQVWCWKVALRLCTKFLPTPKHASTLASSDPSSTTMDWWQVKTSKHYYQLVHNCMCKPIHILHLEKLCVWCLVMTYMHSANCKNRCKYKWKWRKWWGWSISIAVSHVLHLFTLPFSIVHCTWTAVKALPTRCNSWVHHVPWTRTPIDSCPLDPQENKWKWGGAMIQLAGGWSVYFSIQMIDFLIYWIAELLWSRWI